MDHLEEESISSGLIARSTVIKTSWQGLDRRDNEANMSHNCHGLFGVLPQGCTYEAMGETTPNFSEVDEIEDHCRDIFETPTESLDVRRYKHTILSPDGKPFTQAEGHFRLSRAWADSQLGWSTVYLSGRLHMGISLGNVLVTPMEQKRVEQKEFENPRESLNNMSSWEDKKVVQVIEEQSNKVTRLVVGLGIPATHSTVITDGDLAVPWGDYWGTDRRLAKSGTPEFMSRALLSTPGEYLHSPADDLEAFFWVALWCVLFNEKNASQTVGETAIKELLLRNNKAGAANRFNRIDLEPHSVVTERFYIVISEWWEKMRDQVDNFGRAIREPSEGKDTEFYLSHFHRYALQGVSDVLEVLEKHWGGEISWKGWSAPA